MTNVYAVRRGMRGVGDAERRKEFIARMERKLADKVAVKRQKRQYFIHRMNRLREW